MGYNGWVACDCYVKGKAKPFPNKDLEKYLKQDELSGYWEFDAAADINQEEGWRIISDWQRKACEHEDFTYLGRRLANIGGMSCFRLVIEDINKDLVPLPKLSYYLIEANNSSIPANAVRAVLRELYILRQQLPNLPETAFYLIDEENNEDVWEHENHRWPTIYERFGLPGRRIGVGISEEGFFIAKLDPNDEYKICEILFQAQRVEQTVIQWKELNLPKCVEYRNLDTGLRCRCNFVAIDDPTAQSKSMPFRTSIIFYMQEHALNKKAYDYVVQPLIELCHASLQTGNPIEIS